MYVTHRACLLLLMGLVVLIHTTVRGYFYEKTEFYNCGDYNAYESHCAQESREDMDVVDVFFSQLKAGTDPWLYYGSSIEGMRHSIELMMVDSKVRVHIVSDLPEVLALKFKDNDDGHGGQRVFLYNVTHDYESLRADFFDLYKDRHYSGNDVGYEFTCFFRWLLYDKIVQSPSYANMRMSRIMTLDADVVFMNPVNVMFSRVISTLSQGNCSQAFHDFDVAVMGMGSVHLFSSTGLAKYAKYVLSLYKKDVSSVLDHAKKRGRRHYSDMDRMEEFVSENKRQRSFCLTHYKYDFMPEEGVDGVVASWATQKAFFDGIGCVVANTMQAFQKKTKAKILMHKLIEAKDTKTGMASFSDLVQMTGNGIPDDLPLCYLHFQGSHKRVSVQWTLVFLHLYERYRRPASVSEHKGGSEKLFLCKEAYTDVMYLDNDFVLREVGTLGVPPFRDIKGLTIHNENTKEDPLVLLGYFNVHLASGGGGGENGHGRGKLLRVEDSLYWMFKIGSVMSTEEKLSLGF